MHATKLGVLVVLIGCAGPTQQAAPPPAPHGHYVEFGVAVEEEPGGPPGMHAAIVDDRLPGVAEPAIPPSKDQPAHIKLKLGHYRNARAGIGVTIDRTATTDSAGLGPAKVRFDGDAKIWNLDGQHGSFGRLDYVRGGGRVVVHVWKDGRVQVYVPDPDGGASDAIDVYRDADADPL